ncbi:hypothetical protein PYK79_19520 [Streptomyces sp. ID05-04B]|uniref:hypothetical protein n=1 Tax=unclassified Streptomyces TaxID=2593676 RepID=UPI000D1BB371|nr:MULTISPECIES: hypothetical protein [unclassified Streptomyces]AVV43412.1 hypothetical protein C6376_20175 [Streptomyces sp. P3]MDX5565073.1 hypothetical protein [Streptomyces sp. ID05-04B]
MRLSRRLAPATVVAFCLVFSLPYDASPHARVKVREAAGPKLFGAECRVGVHGSRVVAHCHNPYVDTDRVRLHIECDRWWDLDSDGAPVDAGPALTVRLTGRCWKEVRSAWVSHQRV